MFIERIERDKEFFNTVVPKVKAVFMKYVLPELLARNLQSSTDDDTTEAETYCVCEQPAFGKMVACDDPNCLIKWFHFSCVGLSEEPIGDWYCDDCLSKV